MLFNIQLDMFPTMIEEEHIERAASRKQQQQEQIFGLHYCRTSIGSGQYGIPKLEPYNGNIPESFTTFAEVNRHTSREMGVTFFNEDYILERIWQHADKYIAKLSDFVCVTGPDFSLKVGDPKCVQITNVYRNHALSYYFRSKGLNVLPTVTWSNNESYDFCFDGYSRGGAVIVSTVGTLRDERCARYFKNGFLEMLKRLSPDAVVLYGDVHEDMFSWMPTQLDFRFVVNERFNRMRQYGR